MKTRFLSAFALTLFLAAGVAGCIQFRGPTGPDSEEEQGPDTPDPVAMQQAAGTVAGPGGLSFLV